MVATTYTQTKQSSSQNVFRGFLTKLLSEAFYQEDHLSNYITEPDNLNIYDYEDPCDEQIFIKKFLNREA